MTEKQQMNKNRMVLLLIAGIPLTMIFAATWLWYFVVHGDLDLIGTMGTANSGSLVQPPRQIDDSELSEQTGHPFKYADLEPKWTLLIPSSGPDCTPDCERSLYVTRQIHVAIGKEFNRLRRLYVGSAPVDQTVLAVDALTDGQPAPAGLADLLSREHRGIGTATADPAAFSALFGEYLQDPSTWYLVDPAGWIMMSYNSEVHYKDVITDLKFLLKNSSE
jgi:hypothetical protein